MPKLHIDVDQTRARELGLTQQDVAEQRARVALRQRPGAAELLGRSDQRASRTSSRRARRRYKLDSVDAINGDAADERRRPRTRSCWRTSPRSSAASRPEVVNHNNVQPVYDVYANVQGRDLGSVAREIDRVLASYRSQARAGQHDRDARPGGKHGVGVRAAGPGPRLRRGAGLPADGRELPELARPVHHHHGPARARWSASSGRCSCGRRRSACRPDGRDHVDRRGDGEQHPAGHVRQRAAARRARSPFDGGAGSRPDAHAARADDGRWR